MYLVWGKTCSSTSLVLAGVSGSIEPSPTAATKRYTGKRSELGGSTSRFTVVSIAPLPRSVDWFSSSSAGSTCVAAPIPSLFFLVDDDARGGGGGAHALPVCKLAYLSRAVTALLLFCGGCLCLVVTFRPMGLAVELAAALLSKSRALNPRT